MSKHLYSADGFKWYLVSAEAPDGTVVNKFIVGRKRKKMLKKLTEKLRGTNYRNPQVTYLDSDVSVFAAQHSDDMWKR